MAKNSDAPDTIKPYLFQGVDLVKNGAEWVGDCPFCGRESKVSINEESGVGRCLVCGIAEGESGGFNPSSFIRLLWRVSGESTDPELYRELSVDRRISVSTLQNWGVVRSVLSPNNWLVPGYNPDGKMTQLYRWVRFREDGGYVRRLIPTPGLGQKMFGLVQYDPTASTIYVCEGPWDGMRLSEVLAGYRINDSGRIQRTANSNLALGNGATVVAMPGVGSIGESFKKYLPLFRDSSVKLWFDNDHPRNNNGQSIVPAGWSAMRKGAEILTGSPTPPPEVTYLDWGEGGYDPDLPDGYDLRDALGVPGEGLPLLMGRDRSVPEEWVKEPGSVVSEDGDSQYLAPITCSDYGTLVEAWNKALLWTDGLDHALTVMLSSIMSTNMIGDQLWIKVIGPASCGKTTLCEAVSVSRRFVLSKSTIRGFYSGFKTDGAGEEDNSLVVQARGKTLVIKDGDTLLQAPNLGQILSEARDIYDKVGRTHYRNKMSREYTNLNMTFLLCGTASLRSIDNSELGERFLDCVLMDKIDDEMEDRILEMVADKAVDSLDHESGEEASSHQSTEMTRAKQLTGGYVDYLRENAGTLLKGVEFPKEARLYCARLGKLVAHLRARPSTFQDEAPEREFGSRLVFQHVRLAKCLAAVLGVSVVDRDILMRVRRIALDTSRGVGLDIVSLIYRQEEPDEGLEKNSISMRCGILKGRCDNLLKFFQAIGVLETVQRVHGGVKQPIKWRLTNQMYALYESAMMEDYE